MPVFYATAQVALVAFVRGHVAMKRPVQRWREHLRDGGLRATVIAVELVSAAVSPSAFFTR